MRSILIPITTQPLGIVVWAPSRVSVDMGVYATQQHHHQPMQLVLAKQKIFVQATDAKLSKTVQTKLANTKMKVSVFVGPRSAIRTVGSCAKQDNAPK